MSANWNMESPPGTSGNTCFYCECDWALAGIGYSGRLWSLCPWRYSRAVWTWSWATSCRWPCLSRGFILGDLQRFLPTSPTLKLVVKITQWVSSQCIERRRNLEKASDCFGISFKLQEYSGNIDWSHCLTSNSMTYIPVLDISLIFFSFF